jgi:hypothetical protein
MAVQHLPDRRRVGDSYGFSRFLIGSLRTFRFLLLFTFLLLELTGTNESDSDETSTVARCSRTSSLSFFILSRISRSLVTLHDWEKVSRTTSPTTWSPYSHHSATPSTASFGRVLFLSKYPWRAATCTRQSAKRRTLGSNFTHAHFVFRDSGSKAFRKIRKFGHF